MLVVTNTGNAPEVFTLSVAGNAWSTTIYTSIHLPAGEDMKLPVGVMIPADTPEGASDTATVTATSRGDPSVAASANITTYATWIRRYLPLMIKDGVQRMMKP